MNKTRSKFRSCPNTFGTSLYSNVESTRKSDSNVVPLMIRLQLQLLYKVNRLYSTNMLNGLSRSLPLIFPPVDTNECASNPCGKGGQCTDHVNRFTCTCLPNYTGLTCQTKIRK